jgi:hypothetical protein
MRSLRDSWAARYCSQAAMDHSILFFFTFNFELSTVNFLNSQR